MQVFSGRDDETAWRLLIESVDFKCYLELSRIIQRVNCGLRGLDENFFSLVFTDYSVFILIV